MAARMREQATYQDLLEVPENMVAELIEGELFASCLIGPQVAALSALGALIGSTYDLKQRSWRILDKPELHLGDNVLVPDIAGWRRETMPQIPENISRSRSTGSARSLFAPPPLSIAAGSCRSTPDTA
jgi:hypothetical protein